VCTKRKQEKLAAEAKRDKYIDPDNKEEEEGEEEEDSVFYNPVLEVESLS
jgi:hypothetical protein